MPLEDFFEPLRVMDWVTVPDGGGGFIWEWKDGVAFEGGIVLNSSTQMQIAQQTGTKSIYTLTTRKTLPLENGDMIKRLRDDALFKVTAHPADRRTPAFSDINGMAVALERVTA